MIGSIKEAIRQRFGRTLEECIHEEIVPDCQSVLDIGCGSNSALRVFTDTVPIRVGVDAFAPALEESLRHGIHTEVHNMNVLDIEHTFAANSFDCVIANDLLEHLTPADGLRLLQSMQNIARKKVIIFTPNGWVPQEEYGGNPYQKHLSGWTAQRMQTLGFRVTGLAGWKVLRGRLAQPKWRPRAFWEGISLLTTPFCRKRPHLAFQLFCVKNVK